MPVSTGDGGSNESTFSGDEFTIGNIERRKRVLALPPIHPDRNEVGWDLVTRELREHQYHQEHGGRTVCRWNEAWARAILGITKTQLRSLQKAHLAPFLTPGQEFSPDDLQMLARRVFGAKKIFRRDLDQLLDKCKNRDEARLKEEERRRRIEDEGISRIHDIVVN